MLLPAAWRSYIIVDFSLHQQVIAQEDCIQKDVVDNTCQGNCQLTEELEKVENPSPEGNEPITIVLPELMPFVHTQCSLSPAPLVPNLSNSLSNGKQQFYYNVYLSSVDPPPEFSA